MPIFLAGTHWDFPLAATTESLCCSPSSGVRRPAPHSMDWVGMISSVGWDCWLKHGVRSGDKSCRSRREHTLGRVGGQLCSSWVVCWWRNFYASKTHLLGGYEGEWHWVKLPKAELERRYVVGGRQWSGEYVLRIHKPNASQLLGWPPSKGEKRSEIGNHVVVVVGVLPWSLGRLLTLHPLPVMGGPTCKPCVCPAELCGEGWRQCFLLRQLTVTVTSFPRCSMLCSGLFRHCTHGTFTYMYTKHSHT